MFHLVLYSTTPPVAEECTACYGRMRVRTELEGTWIKTVVVTFRIICRYLSGDSEDNQSGFGGLGVACWPLVPKFAGSNPAEAVGFLGAKKSSARLPSEGK